MPKKRTFLSRRTSSQSEISSSGVDVGVVGSAGIVPAPRRNLQRGSSGSSNQSLLKNQDETPQKTVVTASNQVSQSAQTSRSADETPPQLSRDVSQVSSNSSLERERNLLPVTRERSEDNLNLKSLIKVTHLSTKTHDLWDFRPATYTRSDVSAAERETSQRSEERNDDQNQRDHAGLNFGSLSDSSIQDKENSSSVGTATRQEDLSLPQSIVGKFSNKTHLYLVTVCASMSTDV